MNCKRGSLCLQTVPFRANIRRIPDTSENDEYVTNQIAQLILRSDGCFVTSRIMTRKTGRKAKLIRNSFISLTRARHDPDHIGVAKEIGKNMLVFYKCPPEQINESALAKFGLDKNTYGAMFYGTMKSGPSQSILEAVLRDSPYVCKHYDLLLQNYSKQLQQNSLPLHTHSTPTSHPPSQLFADVINDTFSERCRDLTSSSCKKEATCSNNSDFDSSIDVLNDSDHQNLRCEKGAS